MLSPADNRLAQHSRVQFGFQKGPTLLRALQEITMSDQETMRLVAEVVDKFSGPLKEMQKNLRELSKERMRAAPRPRES